MKPDLGTIAMEGMSFHAYHGYYEEEREVGNQFIVDVYIKTEVTRAAINDDLKGTVNYERIYEIVEQIMKEKYMLLEHVTYVILDKLVHDLPAIEHAKIRVSKLSPPIEGDIKRVYVELEKTFVPVHRSN